MTGLIKIIQNFFDFLYINAYNEKQNVMNLGMEIIWVSFLDWTVRFLK